MQWLDNFLSSSLQKVKRQTLYVKQTSVKRFVAHKEERGARREERSFISIIILLSRISSLYSPPFTIFALLTLLIPQGFDPEKRGLLPSLLLVTMGFDPPVGRFRLYSYRKASTGLASAALSVCTLTVINAIINATKPASRKYHQAISILYT